MSKTTRKELFNTVKVLRESEKILPAESKTFKKLIIKANEDDLKGIEEALYEAAQDSEGLMEDINKLAELIYPEFDTEEEAVKFVKENADFNTLEFKGFEIYDIFSRGYNDQGNYYKEVVYHAIVKVEYGGSEYGFGFNKSQRAVSFTQDGEGPFYDNMRAKLDDYDKTITLIKYVIEYIMGVM